MPTNYRTYQPEQNYLLPPSLSDWLPENHLAYFISEVVSVLDLSGFYARHEESDPRGNQPFDPAMMLKVLIYGYARMKDKLATPEGKAAYSRRKVIVEPVFGWVKRVIGFRQFSLRGLENVTAEWNLVCLATNLRRMSAWA